MRFQRVPVAVVTYAFTRWNQCIARFVDSDEAMPDCSQPETIAGPQTPPSEPFRGDWAR